MLVKFNFLSKALMKQTNVTAILPSWGLMDEAKGKTESYLPGTKFQVLYLFHGGTGDDADYVNFSNILRYAEENKIAVIMPSGYNSGYENQSEDILPWPAKYWDYIFEELPKVCAAMFPISTKREDTFVAGLSMGSMAATKWAVYGGQRCCAALLMSGGGMEVASIMAAVAQDNNGATNFEVNKEKLAAKGIQLANPNSKLFKTAKKNAEEKQLLPKIYMACGQEDFIKVFAHASRDLLLSYGYDVEYHEEPGFAHEWDFWDLALRKALYQWLPIKHDVVI